MSRPGGSACTAAIATLLALTVLAYAAAGLGSALENSPRRSTVSARRVVSGFSAEGIVIRDELPLEGGAAPEGMRLGAGDSMGEGLSAPVSGLYFSGCDGYEHLSPEDISTADAPGISALINSAPGEIAKGRLVTGKYWYFAALLPYGISLEVGDTLSADFGSGEIRCLVHAAGEGFAVLRMDTDMVAHAALRHTAAKIITESYSGLAIDHAAVQSEHGESRVRVLTAGREEIKTVNIIFTAPDFLLVEAENEPGALHEGDIVLIGGEANEGKTDNEHS